MSHGPMESSWLLTVDNWLTVDFWMPDAVHSQLRSLTYMPMQESPLYQSRTESSSERSLAFSSVHNSFFMDWLLDYWLIRLIDWLTMGRLIIDWWLIDWLGWQAVSDGCLSGGLPCATYPAVSNDGVYFGPSTLLLDAGSPVEKVDCLVFSFDFGPSGRSVWFALVSDSWVMWLAGSDTQ